MINAILYIYYEPIVNCRTADEIHGLVTPTLTVYECLLTFYGQSFNHGYIGIRAKI